MKDAEDEAFDDLAKRQGAWGGGFTASYLPAVLSAFGPDAGISLDQKAWSKLHSAIQAALAQPVPHHHRRRTMAERRCTFKCGDWNCGSYQFNLYKADIDQGDLCDVHYWQTKAQREWAGLTDEDIEGCVHHVDDEAVFGLPEFARAVEQLLKEKNT